MKSESLSNESNIQEQEVASQENWAEYRRVVQQALVGRRIAAVEGLRRLLTFNIEASLRAHVYNDLGILALVEGQVDGAYEEFNNAVQLAPGWPTPLENLSKLRLKRQLNADRQEQHPARKTRVAILSLLFNWPSTGGGTVHTAETGKFLAQAGYEVRHFFAQFPDWGLGNVSEPPLAPSEAIQFNSEEWTIAQIQTRFRTALQSFQPDWVIVTDSWNSKPILAEAARDYKFLLRIAAQESLCPLNNVRLLYDEGRFHSCPKHQLATASDCCACVYKNGKFSGGLHQAERELVGYGTNEYDSMLRWAFASAEAVLVVNPLIAAMVSPYAKKVCVIPSGFDSSRFPHSQMAQARNLGVPLRILFAGLVDELMKGFDVIHEACRRLWKDRQDFELVVTADPPGQKDDFTRYIGWQKQSALPRTISEADILVFPTIAEEALGRTAVEAMGAGRPVVASRIGGLQFTVVDGATGLLFEPGNVHDLCCKLARLLDDPESRERMGQAGRQRFEEHYTWESILTKHYLPLLGEPSRDCRERGLNLAGAGFVDKSTMTGTNAF